MVTFAADAAAHVREIAHTADVGLEIDAPSLPLLFERAGIGMLALMTDLDTIECSEDRTFCLDGDGVEELLHDWLQRLLVAFQTGGFAIAALEVTFVGDRHVDGIAAGEPFDPARHPFHGELKAVTWHELAVRRVDDGWTARVIFDV